MRSRPLWMIASGIAAVAALYAILVVLAMARPLTIGLVLRPFASTFLFLTLLAGVWHLMRPIRQRLPVIAYAASGLLVGAYAAVAPVLSGLSSPEELKALIVAAQIATFAVIGSAAGVVSGRRAH